jgi:hypothetical protein
LEASSQISADIYAQLKDLRDFGFKDQITRSGLSIKMSEKNGSRKPPKFPLCSMASSKQKEAF